MSVGSSKLRPPQNFALILVAVCLLTSGAIRAGLMTPALAEGLGEPLSQEAAPDPVDYDPLLKAIREREAQLDTRQQQVEERLALLEIAEREFEEKRAELVAAEQKLAETMALADEAAERDIAQITAIYENVKAKQAAQIFESMDPTFAAGVLARMTPQSAADILTAMNAEKAYEISVILAARNLGAGVPAPPG